MKTHTLIALLSFFAAQAPAQTVFFDFDNAPLRSPLPIDLTVGGVTAHFSSTGLGGFSVQPADNMGFTPAGFAGYCLYPSSIDAADLHIAFSRPITDFSILYSPQELGCDSSATLRAIAYRSGVMAGTTTTNATDLCPCTWISQTLAFSSSNTFDSVVVHYDTRPACQDIGTIFMADNMAVTLAPPSPVLRNLARLTNGSFQFTFTNMPNVTFRMFATTNPAVPFSNWTAVAGITEPFPGQYQFVDVQATNISRRFYRVTWP